LGKQVHSPTVGVARKPKPSPHFISPTFDDPANTAAPWP
jgi:hypothetical protein